MSRPYRLPEPRGTPARGLGERLNAYLRKTWSGRILIGTLAVLLLSALGLPLPGVVTGLAKLIFIVFLASWTIRLVSLALHRLFWRIRTKILVSYFFVGFVPIVLLSVFFVIAGVVAVELVSSYMVSSQIDRGSEELRREGRLALRGLNLDDPRVGPLLEQRLQGLDPEGNRLSYALFKRGRMLARRGDVPTVLPEWLHEDGFAGLTGKGGGKDGEKEGGKDGGKDGGEDRGKDGVLSLRAVSGKAEAVLLLDLPADGALSKELEEHTGIHVYWPGDAHAVIRQDSDGLNISVDAKSEGGITAVAGLEWTDWSTGKTDTKFLPIRFSPAAVLRRLSPRSIDFGDIFVKVLLVVGGLFLVVYALALGLGLLLAWSITGSVHALSRGTERLRQGDFSNPITVRSRDQLGELAESFNMMVQGIQDLLREQAEKERLEEELRIARQIQMSLLPEGSVALQGLRVEALCLPAAEVGGDYYDLLPLSDTRMGVLVADVSGKGTSAALYMAELKGLMLSLSRIYDSPARLLSEANRILTAHLDSRSFVTMIYALVDTDKMSMRFARAGHNPVIHLEGATGRTRVLTPQGIGLGIDEGERFDAVLEESEVSLVGGDIFFFFTDGISEAMNENAELFGERRLRDLIEAAGSGADDLGLLRNRILEGVRVFAGGAPQHDDMTLMILKVV
jgi:serine phosphatase RsbU (regulator of sigma subunit)